jgi:hypothetical protein
MYRLFVFGFLLLAGCHSNTTVGPFEHRNPRMDDPLLAPTDQKARGRANLALPDESATTEAQGAAESAGAYGR